MTMSKSKGKSKRVLNAGEIMRALKQPFGITNMMNKFHYDTIEDLLAAIRKNLKNCDGFVRDVSAKFESEEKNKPKQRRQSSFRLNEVPEYIVLDIKEPQQVVSSEGTEETPAVVTSEESEKIVKHPAEKTLDELLQQEAELSDKFDASENAWQESCSDKKEILQKITEEKAALEEIKRLLNDHEKSFSNLYADLKKCETKIKEHTAKKTELFSELQAVRIKIEELKHVTIFVYINGSIEAENAEIPEIPVEKIAENMTKLFSIPEVGKVIVDELKAIARLQEIVKQFQHEGKKYDIMFENGQLQKLWEVLTL